MYNTNMDGVDRLAQNVAKYFIVIRGKKWYIPILSYLLNACMNNAWLFARKADIKGMFVFFSFCMSCCATLAEKSTDYHHVI